MSNMQRSRLATWYEHQQQAGPLNMSATAFSPGEQDPGLFALLGSPKPKAQPKARNVQVRLQYLADDPLYDTTKPMQITPNFADTEHRTNVKLSPGEEETLHNVRGQEDKFSLDANGFCYVKAPTTFKDWTSQPQIGQVYLKEIEELLRREVDGCDEILFYDARIRQAGDEGVRVAGLSLNPFARQVHTDNTERSVIEKIRSLTEMKADFLLKGRARAINIWRPIKHPVYDCGLAIADGGNLKEGDVIECDRHRSDTGKYWDTMGVIKYRPGFKWYYMSEQDEEDVLLFKNFDTATDVPSRCCLHTAFDLPPQAVPVNAPTRESIEVRALIFTHPRDLDRMSHDTIMQQATRIPDPLAASLEREELKAYVDNEHSITDRVRIDIDEAKEVKDAVLLLRRKEIKSLERVRDVLTAELGAANDQIAMQRGHIEALQEELASLIELNHTTPTSPLSPQTSIYSPRGTRTSAKASAPLDVDLLRQTIDRQDKEIRKWKAEAEGKGNEAVSRAWQAGLERRLTEERRKDAFVVAQLQGELSKLKWEMSRP